jgi:hypothetical protein
MILKMVIEESRFNAPIPGESLTAELGGRPWQTPAKITTVDEAIDYYMERMSSEEFMEQVVEIMESGVPVAVIANTIQLASVMDGIHSVDVGMLVVPVIMEMMMLLGDSAGIKYSLGDEKFDEEITDSKIAKAVSTYKKKVKDGDIKKPEVIAEDKEEEPVKAEPTGLMARRK